jgi:hypothetical protein
MYYEFNDYPLQVRSDEQEAPTSKPASGNPEARVGLSIVGNLNANYNRGPVKKLRIEQFLNTEIKVTTLHNFKPTAPAPREPGMLIQEGLTKEAKAKIKRSGRMLQYHARERLNTKWLSFITLTYGKDWPDDPTAKNHLNRFLNKVRRRYGKIRYVWVVERQKRGAIHYHILTDQYIPKNMLNPMWDKIVAKWQAYEGHQRQTVRPNVIGIDTNKPGQAEHYLMKYMTKKDEHLQGNLYNISQPLRELMKPTACYEIPTSNPEAILSELLENDNLEEIIPIEIEGSVCEETGEIFMKQVGCFLKQGNLNELLSNVVNSAHNTRFMCNMEN